MCIRDRLLGVPEGPEPLDGRSLVPLLQGEREWSPRPLLLEDKLTRSVFGLREGDLKLVSDLHNGDRKLFDLRADPGELRNIAAENPAALAELSSALRSTLARSRATASRSGAQKGQWEEILTRDEIERLRSLGYVD